MIFHEFNFLAQAVLTLVAVATEADVHRHHNHHHRDRDRNRHRYRHCTESEREKNNNIIIAIDLKGDVDQWTICLIIIIVITTHRHYFVYHYDANNDDVYDNTNDHDHSWWGKRLFFMLDIRAYGFCAICQTHTFLILDKVIKKRKTETENEKSFVLDRSKCTVGPQLSLLFWECLTYSTFFTNTHEDSSNKLCY